MYGTRLSFVGLIHMAYIDTISEENADGIIAQEYEKGRRWQQWSQK